MTSAMVTVMVWTGSRAPGPDARSSGITLDLGDDVDLLAVEIGREAEARTRRLLGPQKEVPEGPEPVEPEP